MTDNSIGTPEQLADPSYIPPLKQGIPLGIQHVLAMFASNLAPSFIVAGAAGIGQEIPYLIQMAMFFSGVTTLFQSVGIAFVGARLPIMMGTSFAFVPIMIGVAQTSGMDAVMGAILVSGMIQASLGLVIGRIRFLLPPLVTGLVVLTIGLSLLPVGIQYAAGGLPLLDENNAFMYNPEAFGGLMNWTLAGTVVLVTLCLQFFTRGFLQMSAVLFGLLAGYILAVVLGQVSFGGLSGKPAVALPDFLHFGLKFEVGAIVAMVLIGFISAIETVGDVSGITKGGADREATEKELAGATWADGLGSALGGLFGALPNTSFSQNVGLIAMTKVMSTRVVTIGAIFLIVAGLLPIAGAMIATLPTAVLGGGVIVMFGMIASAGLSMLAEVKMNRRNMIIIATALSIGLGLRSVPEALQHVKSFDLWLIDGNTIFVMLTTGLIPVAVISIVLDRILPENLSSPLKK